MSKPIPQEEYNKKPLTRLLQWVNGEIDPYQEVMETRKQGDYKPNEWLIRMHRRDQENVIHQVHDQKHNRVYKNFRRFYLFIHLSADRLREPPCPRRNR